MSRKKPGQELDESSEKFKPHTAKLARWLRSTIEQHDENINAFVQKAQSRDQWKLPSSTFYQICRAQAVITPDTAKKAAHWLKRLYGVKVEYTDLLNMIEDEPPADLSPPRIEREILSPTTINWHFTRLPFDERLTIWPNILNQASKDLQSQPTESLNIPVGRNVQIDVITRMIHDEASRRRIGNARDLAASIMKSTDSEEIELGLRCLHQILVERRWPYQDTEEYRVLIPSLATALNYQSAEELESYCGLITQNSP
jgi:hypothetical protein